MRKHIISLAKKGLRIDGRGFDDLRTPIKVIKGYAKKAEGSAMAVIGETRVLTGVKLGVGEPFPDTPDEGALMVSTELTPFASPKYESGPPSPEAVEAARTVDRGIRESKAIDNKKLCIKPGEAVWMVFIDNYAWNYNGNLIDASALAAIAALQDAKLPKWDGKRVVYEKTKKQLPLLKTPVATSFVKIGNYIMIDPRLDEEKVMDARLTVTTSGTEVNALQKSGKGGFTQKEVDEMIEKSFKKRVALLKALEGGGK